MKYLLTIAIIVAVGIVPCVGSATGVPDMNVRTPSINFEATLLDDADLPYDGQVAVDASFYRAPSSDPANLVYAESFGSVEVDGGLMRVPLLTGTPEGGTSFSLDAFAAEDELFVDILVDGVALLTLHPLRSSFAAIRAEYARYADGLRADFDLLVDEVPVHSASLITNETFDPARIPNFSAAKIASGSFGVDQVPNVSGSTLTDGPFSIHTIPSNLNASNISGGVLLDDVVASAIIRRGNITLSHGTVNDGDHLSMPGGAPPENCKILLGMNHGETDNAGQGLDWWQVYEESGTVRCRFSHREDQGDLRYCTANYLIICMQ